MDGGSLTRNMIVYKGRLLKKSSKRKSKLILSMLVTTWLSNIAFQLWPIWLQTLVPLDSESRLAYFPSFCAQPSEVTVLFNLNLSRRPFLQQVVDLHLLLCTGFNSEHVFLFPCHIFTQRPMTDRKIEWSNGRCFGWQCLANSIEIFISHEKKSDLDLSVSSWPKICKGLKPCWLLNWVSIARVVVCFLQASLSLPAATATNLETPCVCARLSYPRKQRRRTAQRAWQLILPSKPLITFWNSLQRDCQMTSRDSKLELCSMTNQL